MTPPLGSLPSANISLLFQLQELLKWHNPIHFAYHKLYSENLVCVKKASNLKSKQPYKMYFLCDHNILQNLAAHFGLNYPFFNSYKVLKKPL